MTRDEILAMPAGEALDALVAEHVMGLKRGVDFGEWPEHDWKRDEDGEIDIFGYEEGVYHNGPGCKRCGWGYCHHCEDWDPENLPEDVRKCVVAPLLYSSNLWAVGQVVEHLRSQDYRLRLNDNGDWDARFYHYPNAATLEYVNAATAPEAICKAALLAVLGEPTA